MPRPLRCHGWWCLRCCRTRAWYDRHLSGPGAPRTRGEEENGEEGQQLQKQQQKPKGKGPEEKESQPPTEKALTLLTHALTLCDAHLALSLGYHYREELEKMKRLLLPRYEAVSPAEIAAIKRAMVEGPGGFATHLGRWYTCVNGHPVSGLYFFQFIFCSQC